MKKAKLASPVNLAAMNAAAGSWGFASQEALTTLAGSVDESGHVTVHRDLLEEIDGKVFEEIEEARDEGADDARREDRDNIAHVNTFLSKLGLSLDEGDAGDTINKWRDSHEYRGLLIEVIELLGLEPTMPLIVLRDRVLSAVKALKAAR